MKNIIDDYRKAHGLTYEKMAVLAGFNSRSVVFLHCSGQRSISAESAIKYSRAFGLLLSDLRPDLWPPDAVAATPTTASGSEGQTPSQEARDA